MERPKETPFSTDPMRVLLEKDDPKFAGKLANMRSGRKAFLQGAPRDTYPVNADRDGWRREHWIIGWDFAAEQEGQ
jgi:hypothetical protein